MIRLNKFFNYKYIILIGAAIFVLLPLLLFFIGTYNQSELFFDGKFSQKYIFATLIQIFFVTIFATIMGLFLAFYQTFFVQKHLFLHKFLSLSPLAFPSFIFGVIYTDIFDKIAFFTIENFGINKTFAYEFFDISSIAGTIFVLSCILYPYVYMSTMVGFKSVSKYFFENGAVYGYKPLDIVFNVVLKLVFPSVCVGIILIIMEVLNDFGVSYYFGVQTISVGIFNIWNSGKSFNIIVEIITFMLGFSILLIYLVSKFDKSKQQISSHNIVNEKINLIINKWQKNILTFIYYFILLICFGLPFLYTVFMGLKYMSTSLSTEFVAIVLKTITFGFIVAFIICMISFVISYCNRDLHNKKIVKFTYPIITSGYAISGIVVGLCVLVSYIYVDNIFYQVVNFFKKDAYAKTIDYSFIILTIAYFIKYLKLGIVNIMSSMSAYSYQLDYIIKIMGIKRLNKIKNILFPMSKVGFFMSFIIIFIELIKELPIMLLLKPVGFETISTYIYQYYSDELFEYAYFGSMIIIIISMIPIYILSFDKTK